jgi:hypothetical protein
MPSAPLPALHSVYETGISTVANLHLASAARGSNTNDASLHFMSADVKGRAAARGGRQMRCLRESGSA